MASSRLALLVLSLAPAVLGFSVRTSPSMALAGFAKKLKQTQVDQLKAQVASDPEHPIAKKMAEAESAGSATPSKLYDALKKPQGTVSVLAEYKRKLPSAGALTEVLPPRIMSSVFRAAGAAAASVALDPSVGGASEEDFGEMRKEQQTVMGDYPGPLPLIAHDLVIDEVQIAAAAVSHADAVTVSWSVNGEERVKELVAFGAKLGMETVVQVNSAEDLKAVVDGEVSRLVALMGCKVEEGEAAAVHLPEDRSILGLATVDLATKEEAEDLVEVTSSWRLRDAGWGCIWASDILYRDSSDSGEDATAIIKAIKMKTSSKFGTAKGIHGKGEGAKEYLGYLAM